MSGCLNRTMLHLLIQKSKTSSNVIKAIVLFDVQIFLKPKIFIKACAQAIYISTREFEYNKSKNNTLIHIKNNTDIFIKIIENNVQKIYNNK